jgi:hypothetical protein
MMPLLFLVFSCPSMELCSKRFGGGGGTPAALLSIAVDNNAAQTQPEH